MKNKTKIVVEIAVLAGLVVFGLVNARAKIAPYLVSDPDPGHEALTSDAADMADNSGLKPELETNESERPLYKIPSVTLEDEDRVIPEDWRDEVLLRLNYNQLGEQDFFPGLFSRPPSDVAVPFCLGNYDEAISKIQRRLEQKQPMTREGVNISSGDDFRALLDLWAHALEFKGDLEGAESLYRFIYPSGSRTWIRYRLEYLAIQSGDDLNKFAPLGISIPFFWDFCRFVTKSAGDWNIDEMLEELQGKLEDAVDRDYPISVIPCPSVFDREELPFRASIFRLYCFRNNCATFVNPTLPYAYACSVSKFNGVELYRFEEQHWSKEVKVSRVLLERKSYAVFLSQMEGLYEAARRYVERNAKGSSESDEAVDEFVGSAPSDKAPMMAPPCSIPDYVDRAMEIFRKVGELPY